MFEIQILIPVAFNSGELIDRSHVTEYVKAVTKLAGGCTWYPAPRLGGWRSPSGEMMIEEMTCVVVGVKSLSDCAWLPHAVDLHKRLFQQEATCVRYLGITEVL